MDEAVSNIPTWISIVITTLSALTASLICWQVFMVIDLYRTKRDINRRIKESFSDFNHHVSAGTYLAMSKVHLQSFHQLKFTGVLTNKIVNCDSLEKSLEHIVLALESLNKSSMKEQAEGIYETLVSILSVIENNMRELKSIKPETLQNIILNIMKDGSDQDNINKITILNRLLEIQRKLANPPHMSEAKEK